MKRLSIQLLTLLMLSLALPLQVCADSGHEQLLQRAQQLLSSYKDTEALSLYETVLREAPDNYQALCMASMLHSRIGDRFPDDTRKMEHFDKAKQYATQAYELNPSDAESNYSMALSLACAAMVSGPKQRLSVTNQIKSFLDAALADNSAHAGAWHLLGRWHFKMANLNFAEVVASKMFFGGVCGEASNGEAVQAMKMAIQHNPNNIRYYFDLATIYQELKAKEDCKDVLQQAVALNSLETKDDLELSRRCKIMLQQLGQ